MFLWRNIFNRRRNIRRERERELHRLLTRLNFQISKTIFKKIIKTFNTRYCLEEDTPWGCTVVESPSRVSGKFLVVC